MPEHRNECETEKDVAGRKCHILPAVLLDKQSNWSSVDILARLCVSIRTKYAIADVVPDVPESAFSALQSQLSAKTEWRPSGQNKDSHMSANEFLVM